MATTTKAKQERTLNLKGDKLRIRDARTDETYTVRRIDDGEGTTLGYRLEKKSDGSVYDVDTVDGRCDCRGFFSAGRCKHEAGIRKLISLGMI